MFHERILFDANKRNTAIHRKEHSVTHRFTELVLSPRAMLAVRTKNRSWRKNWKSASSKQRCFDDFLTDSRQPNVLRILQRKEQPFRPASQTCRSSRDKPNAIKRYQLSARDCGLTGRKQKRSHQIHEQLQYVATGVSKRAVAVAEHRKILNSALFSSSCAFVTLSAQRRGFTDKTTNHSGWEETKEQRTLVLPYV